ncbi:MAG: nuclear transport factor 2 family protein [Deltaproteobacteria bacterium]|nr:nuclear transport factor 2 family protein [Deltaproteobacteria bacterium]
MDVGERLASLEARLRAVEDELAIHKLIVRYGLAVDSGDAERTAAVFAADGVYDADVRLMRGRAAVADMVRGARHQAMVGHCAHQIGPAIVRLHGDTATALGYSRVYLQEADGIGVYRVSFNRWTLARQADGWAITHRFTRLLGHEEALAILHDGLDAV